MTLESILKEAARQGFMLHQLVQTDATMFRCNFKAKFCNDRNEPFFWYGGADEDSDPVKCMATALRYAVDGCPDEPTQSNVAKPFPVIVPNPAPVATPGLFD